MGRIRKINIPEWAKSLLIFLAGIASFIFILVNRQPIPLRPMALQVRYGFTLFAPIALMLFYLIFSIKGFAGRLLSFVAILSLFALGLSGLWASGQTEPQVIGGLLPNVDAAEYYYDALRLLNGSNFFDYSSRRPVFPSYLAALLWLSGKNLQVTIGLMVLVAALCTWLAMTGIRKQFSPLVSATFLILVYFYYRRYGGLVMSENLGFSLGLLSFALFISGSFEGKIKRILLALFLLSYALNVRAGAFFILPLLLIGLLQLQDVKTVWKTIGAALALIAAGFLINLFLFRTLGSPTGTPFSNFAHTFYGLAQGGKGWTQIYTDHPDILSFNESEISRRIYEYSLAAIRANPWNLVSGLIGQYGVFFNFINSNLSVFSFVHGENVVIYSLTQILLYFLSAIGLYHAIRWRKQPFYQLLLLSLAGTMLSVPFITADASYMRAYAASIAFLVILPALGLKEITSRFPKLDKANVGVPAVQMQNHVAIMVILLIALPLIALLPRMLNHPENTSKRACPDGQENVVIEISAGSYLNIFPNEQFFLDWVPNLHESRFKKSYISSQLDYMRDEVRMLPARIKISNTIDLYSNEDLMLIFVNENLMNENGRLSICGIWSSFPIIPGISRYFYVDAKSVIT